MSNDDLFHLKQSNDDDLPDYRSVLLDDLCIYEKEYGDDLNSIRSAVENIEDLFDEQLAETLIEKVNSISQISNKITGIVITLKMHDIVRKMFDPESDWLNEQLEIKLQSIHVMMTTFNRLTDIIRNIKRKYEENNENEQKAKMRQRLELFKKNMPTSKSKRMVQRILDTLV
jgi:hypothetical protein